MGMPRRGVEPPRPCEHWHLKPACLPFHHLGKRKSEAKAVCDSVVVKLYVLWYNLSRVAARNICKQPVSGPKSGRKPIKAPKSGESDAVILTVTPNAAVDKTYRVENFSLDRVHRPQETLTVAGGKGINVARVFQTLGGKAIATGFLGGNQGQIVANALAREHIPNEFVTVSGETRVCIAIVDPQHGTQTEVNERGPDITAHEVERLRTRYAELLSLNRFDFVVLSGSLPPGTPETLYADLIATARKAGVQAVLDTSGEALRHGIDARPWLIKPNKAELEILLNRPVRDRADVIKTAQDLHKAGIANVVISQGADGAIVAGESGLWQGIPPKIEFASAVASGDSFVAAYLWAWLHGEKPGIIGSALRFATGAGAANAMVIGAGFCTRDSIFEQAERAEVHAIQ